MNEIEFRGKRKYGPEYLIGDISHIDGSQFISPRNESVPSNSPDWFEVDPNTVGQYTGFVDKDRSRIFGKDHISYAGKCYTVKMVDGCWRAVLQGGSYQFYLSEITSYCKLVREDYVTVKQSELLC